MALVGVKKIELQRAEGIGANDQAVTCLNYEAANRELLTMSTTAPKECGCDKVDFEVTFKDDTTYKGTYGLKHHSIETPNLSAHIVDFVRFVGGLLKENQIPSHVPSDFYFKNYKDEEYAALHANYDLGPEQLKPSDEQPRPITKKCEISVGTPIHCILYGGRYGAVYAIHGEQKPETCEFRHGVMAMGGNAKFDIVFEDGSLSHLVPESILWGVQWTVFTTIKPQSYFDNLLRVHEERVKREDQEKKDAAIARENLKATLSVEYNYLITNVDRGGKGAGKNIRVELKRAFPGIKFSVRTSYDSVNIDWTDGPTRSQVDEIINKYKNSRFNGYEDCFEHSSTAFNDLFGGCKYISTNRDYSDEAVKDAIDTVFVEYDGNLAGVQKPTVEDFKSGKLYNVTIPGLTSHLDSIQQHVHRSFSQRSYVAD